MAGESLWLFEQTLPIIRPIEDRRRACAVARAAFPVPETSRPNMSDLKQSKPGSSASSRPYSGGVELPPYTRSLLRIKVPVIVTLAEKRQPLGRVVELSPGAIIHFDKSCEEMLDLFVGNRRVASGEAVKVGDKFGLRITSITPSDERFYPLKPGGG